MQADVRDLAEYLADHVQALRAAIDQAFAVTAFTIQVGVFGMPIWAFPDRLRSRRSLV